MVMHNGNVNYKGKSKFYAKLIMQFCNSFRLFLFHMNLFQKRVHTTFQIHVQIVFL